MKSIQEVARNVWGENGWEQFEDGANAEEDEDGVGVVIKDDPFIYFYLFYLFIRTFTFQTAALAKSGAFIQQHI